METLITVLLILSSFSLSAFLIYRGITGVKKTIRENK